MYRSAALVSACMAAIVASSPSIAFAADLGGGSYKDTYAAPSVITSRNWTGFYLGAHIGGNWSNYSVNGRNTGALGAFDNLSNTKYTIKPSQFIGGGQVGYNWQFDGLVLGFEGQYSYGGSSSKTRNPTALVGTTELPTSRADDYATVKLRDTATLAARFGFANGAWMPYVKVGAAWAKIRGVAGDTDEGLLNPADATSFSRWQVGWLVGGGLEYMLDRNWSLRGEYQYMDYGSFNSFSTDGGRYKHSMYNHNFSVGVNYRF